MALYAQAPAARSQDIVRRIVHVRNHRDPRGHNGRLLTSLTVATALFVDFLLLPTLLLAFDRKRAESPASSGNVTRVARAAARAAAL